MKIGKKRRNLTIIMTILLLILLVALFFVWRTEEIDQKDESISLENDLEVISVDNNDEMISIENDLEIINIGNFEGKYMEDGSDEQVSDVMMIVIKNNGDQTLQYAELKMVSEGMTAEFAFSTLPPGKEMLVLEKNRQSYSGEIEDMETYLENVVFFDEPLSLCENVLKVHGLDGALNIENISGKDISGPIAVYYKTIKDDCYYGGITYRALIEDGLKAGEIRQVMTNHFLLDESEVLFVTCVP